MTVIPKHIANPAVKTDKWRYRYRFVIVLILLAVIVCIYTFIRANQHYGLWVLALYVLLQYRPIFDKRITQFAEEVNDTGTHLSIKKDNAHYQIDYRTITSVSYHNPTLLLNTQAPFVCIRLNKSSVDDAVYFKGWGDPKELKAWVDRLNNRINPNADIDNPHSRNLTITAQHL